MADDHFVVLVELGALHEATNAPHEVRPALCAVAKINLLEHELHFTVPGDAPLEVVDRDERDERGGDDRQRDRKEIEDGCPHPVGHVDAGRVAHGVRQRADER